MDFLKGINIEQMQAVATLFIVLLAGLISVAEIAVRFTKTKSDDGAVKRVGTRIDLLLNLLKVPNRTKDMPPSQSDLDYKKSVDNHE